MTTDTHTFWQDLVAAGLLGVERRAFTAAPAGPLGDMLAGLPAPTPAEQRWLAAAAAAGLYWRAGREPLRLPSAAEAPAPEADWPACSPAAAQHLATMLTGQFAEVLPEWLARLAAARRCVAADLLPAALDLGRARPELRAALMAVLGPRGQWLAAQNADWEYASYAAYLPLEADTQALTAAWETGRPAARAALLWQLRARQPALARTLLALTWQQEQAEQRVLFIEALAEGLSLEDEPLLETALDDRAKTVRAAAAELLARLPESAFAQRMAARLAPLLHLERGWFNRRKFDLELPAVCDPAMQRDAVEPKPRGKRGERAWWLLQIVAAAPLAFWTNALGAPPAECVRLSAGLEWRGLLWEGWSQAVTRQAALPAAADWAEALVSALLLQAEAVSFGPLLLALPRERREALVLGHVQAEAVLSDGRPALRLLAETWDQWSAAFSAAVLEALARHIAGDHAVHPGPALSLLGQAAFCVAPAAGLQAGEQLVAAAGEQPYWPAAVARFLTVVSFRNEMIKALEG
ncbi:MAG: hypothetical protein IT317_20320 [Anaerolineales bacterium]|nr:hypothetical protein [Anaerolineales bacterium]